MPSRQAPYQLRPVRKSARSFCVESGSTGAAGLAGVSPAMTLSSRTAKRREEGQLNRVPSIYRGESSPVGEADRAMRGNHRGSLSYWRRWVGRGFPGHDFVFTDCQSSRGGPTQQSPIHIPEGEQPRRRSRPGDEREPSGFPLISSSAAGLAGVSPAMTLSSRTANRREEGQLNRVPSIYRRESSPVGEADRAMRGNHPGSLSYLVAPLGWPGFPRP